MIIKEEFIDYFDNNTKLDEISESFKCTICEKSFKTEKHLIWHGRYHQQDNEPSTCSICNKLFQSKYRLDKHKLIHKYENCICAVCQQSFASQDDLKLHISEKHKRDIKCSKCSKVCVNYTKYLTHINKPHDNTKESIISNPNENLVEVVKKKRGRKPKPKKCDKEGREKVQLHKFFLKCFVKSFLNDLPFPVFVCYLYHLKNILF